MKSKLFGRLAYRCKLNKPLPIIIFREQRHYVVHDEPMYSFGIGATKGEALAEYKRIVATDYLWMKQQEAFLSPALQVEWTYLKQFVCRY